MMHLSTIVQEAPQSPPPADQSTKQQQRGCLRESVSLTYEPRAALSSNSSANFFGGLVFLSRQIPQNKNRKC